MEVRLKTSTTECTHKETKTRRKIQIVYPKTDRESIDEGYVFILSVFICYVWALLRGKKPVLRTQSYQNFYRYNIIRRFVQLCKTHIQQWLLKYYYTKHFKMFISFSGFIFFTRSNGWKSVRYICKFSYICICLLCMLMYNACACRHEERTIKRVTRNNPKRRSA